MTKDALTTTAPRRAETRPAANGSSKQLYIFISLSVLFILLIGFIIFVVATPDWPAPPANEMNQNAEYLIETNPEKAAKNPVVEISAWIIALVAGFAALQILPIMLAARKAKKKRYTQIEKREITFLCEIPMYLGLLGSLLGVCLTQFMTGTLSAPLAYITTISGILLHLFAKFAIIVPLPGKAAGIAEEV